MIRVADLNKQIGVRRFQQFRQYGKLFTPQLERLISRLVHEGTLLSGHALRFHLTPETCVRQPPIPAIEVPHISALDRNQRLKACHLVGKLGPVGSIYHSGYIFVGAGRLLRHTAVRGTAD